jgi:hypothetical protein
MRVSLPPITHKSVCNVGLFKHGDSFYFTVDEIQSNLFLN